MKVCLKVIIKIIIIIYCYFFYMAFKYLKILLKKILGFFYEFLILKIICVIIVELSIQVG